MRRVGHRSRHSHPCRSVLLCLLGLFATAAGAQEDPTRVAYVDMQRLLDNAPQVVDGRARLTSEFAARDAQLRADEQRLIELEARLSVAQDDSALRSEAAALRRSVARSKETLRSQLNRRTQEEIDRAWPIINDAVSEYAREHGYDLVIPSPVIYFSGRIDITDRVIDELRRDAAESAP